MRNEREDSENAPWCVVSVPQYRAEAYSPPVHASAAAAPAATVSYVLAVTSAARDPQRAFAAAVAVADAVQPSLVLPTRRVIAQRQSADQPRVSDAAQRVLLDAAEIARAETLDIDVLSALSDQQRALRDGTKSAAQASKDGSVAIDRILADHCT